MAKDGGHVKSGKAGSVKAQSKKFNKQMIEDDLVQPGVPFVLQQKCLNIFRDALKPSGADGEILQEIKGHLYGRDFATAFGKEEYLRVYASRWSPSRALAYLQIFNDVQSSLVSHNYGQQTDEDGMKMTVVSLGGGAGAELVAIACWLSIMRGNMGDRLVYVRLLDIADWNVIAQELHRRSETPPELSKYASAAAKETNQALLPEKALTVDFTQQDVLDWPETHLSEYCKGAKLITLMFTLNELYSMSIQKTQRFLAHLTAITVSNTFLLVVDSPGSYSTVSINATEKKYPMSWLLDHTLLATTQEVGKAEIGAKWERVLSDDSRWFRLPQGLRYPIELENMRYQIHLYRRVGGDGDSGSVAG